MNDPKDVMPRAPADHADPRRTDLLMRALAIGRADIYPGIDQDGRRFVIVEVFPAARSQWTHRLALDASGIPVMTDALRDALLRAMAAR